MTVIDLTLEDIDFLHLSSRRRPGSTASNHALNPGLRRDDAYSIQKFNAPLIKDGVRRFVSNDSSSASPRLRGDVEKLTGESLK